MANTRRNLAATLAMAATVLVCASAMAEEHQARIVLRVTDYASIPIGQLGRAQAEVTKVYAQIGVEVVWTTSDTATYTVLILSQEPAVKFIAAEHVADNVLGQAVRGLKRAYIFKDRVREASTRAPIDFQKLLGKVIAHEVGHLLLTSGHSATGIMRAGMQVRNSDSAWFTKAQGADIRMASARE